MKYFIVLFVTIITTFVLADELNPRLGKEIDLYERDYFGLFPWEDKFESATFKYVRNDSIIFTINKNDDTNYEFGIPKNYMSLFNYYIENYEGFGDKFSDLPLQTQSQWEYFKDAYLDYDYNFEKAKLVKYRTIGNEEVVEPDLRLLYADDEYVYLYRGQKYYNFENIESKILPIKVTDLTTLKINYFFFIYNIYDINGSLESYEEYYKKISEKDAFAKKSDSSKPFLPKEFKELIDRIKTSNSN